MTTTAMNSQQSPIPQQPPISQQSPLLKDAWLRSLMSRDHRPNVLVQCSQTWVATAAAEMAGLCAHPLRVCRVPGALSLPARSSGSTGTFLIGDVSRLTLQQQINLWDWMTYRNRGIQVVSITSVPLLPLVEDGRFLESLFYRLNMICVTAAHQNG